MNGTAALAQASRSLQTVAEQAGGLLAGLLELRARRFECGSLRSYPPRRESDGSVADGLCAWDVEQAGRARLERSLGVQSCPLTARRASRR